MNPVEQKYWFRARRYGWGWGLPVTWQGWVVLVLWGAAFALGTVYLPPASVRAHLLFALAMTGLLLMICYAKGEPPRWRSG